MRLLAVLLLLAVLCPGMASAKSRRKAHAKPPAKTAEKPAPPVPPAAQPPGPPPVPRIPLQPYLRFVIRPTLLGLVPPGDPQGYGDCFVRVTRAGTDEVSAHFEIKELEGAQTRIRRGDVSATGIAGSHRFEPPVLWGDGGWDTDSGLLWLGRTAYGELAGTGTTALDLAPGPAQGGAAASGLQQVIAQRRAQLGIGAADPVRLVVQDWRATYPALVNGARADLPALRCLDTVRLAEYWVLRDADNPMLLKMTYLEPPISALPRTPGDAGQQLIDTGSGFAVVSIDF